jgi:hypothetical protein
MATMDSGKRFNRESKCKKKNHKKERNQNFKKTHFKFFISFVLSLRWRIGRVQKKEEKKDKIGARIYRQFPP